MRRRSALVLSIVCIAPALPIVGCGDGEAAGEPPSRADVQAALEEAVDSGAPGIAVEIRSSEGDEFLTAGVASLEPEQGIEAADRFRIASVTKAFTGAIVMDLVREGELALDETVEQVVPDLITAGESITIEQLLQHTSGLPDYVESEGFARRVGAGRPISIEQVLGFFAEQPPEFEPGTEYHYSDSDNIVLGLIIEEVTGRPYEEELRLRVLEPLGLDHTTLATEAGRIPGPHWNGYQYESNAGAEGPVDVTDLEIDPNGAWASGALISTAGDVSRFFAGLLGGELLGEDQLERMMDTVPGEGSPPGPGQNNAGLGIFGYELGCGEIWGHTGSWPGYRTFGAAGPDGEGSVAMLVNATELPARANEAIVRAQELAACRALGEPLD